MFTRTAAQLAALKSEIQTDPLTYGYPAVIAQHNTLADLINKVRDGSDGEAAITIRRTDISVADVYAAIEVADYAALPGSPTAAQLSTERRYLGWLSGLAAFDTVRLLNDDGTDAPPMVNFKAMFPVSGTRTRLTALASRFGSRAEQLFGIGTVVADTDIALALRS